MNTPAELTLVPAAYLMVSVTAAAALVGAATAGALVVGAAAVPAVGAGRPPAAGAQAARRAATSSPGAPAPSTNRRRLDRRVLWLISILCVARSTSTHSSRDTGGAGIRRVRRRF